MHTLTVSTKFSAMHRWPGAPERRSYLRMSHRHDFQVLIRVPVDGADREREFHDLHDELDHVLMCIANSSIMNVPEKPEQNMIIYDFCEMSCEQIGKQILAKMPHVEFVSVWEDSLHGAETCRKILPGRKIITVCGSTKFKQDTLRVIKMLEDRGYIALAVGSFMQADAIQVSEETKKEYDRLHLDKIRMSHGIFVVNTGGYIGESTQGEINMARSLGLSIDYLVSPDERIGIRNGVMEFAVEMEAKLLKNDHKGGWEDHALIDLFDLLLEEKNELEEALYASDCRHIIEECADVANFAMMIANNATQELERS